MLPYFRLMNIMNKSFVISFSLALLIGCSNKSDLQLFSYKKISFSIPKDWDALSRTIDGIDEIVVQRPNPLFDQKKWSEYEKCSNNSDDPMADCWMPPQKIITDSILIDEKRSEKNKEYFDAFPTLLEGDLELSVIDGLPAKILRKEEKGFIANVLRNDSSLITIHCSIDGTYKGIFNCDELIKSLKF